VLRGSAPFLWISGPSAAPARRPTPMPHSWAAGGLHHPSSGLISCGRRKVPPWLARLCASIWHQPSLPPTATSTSLGPPRRREQCPSSSSGRRPLTSPLFLPWRQWPMAELGAVFPVPTGARLPLAACRSSRLGGVSTAPGLVTAKPHYVVGPRAARCPACPPGKASYDSVLQAPNRTSPMRGPAEPPLTGSPEPAGPPCSSVARPAWPSIRAHRRAS